jgi:hypothetical protein
MEISYWGRGIWSALFGWNIIIIRDADLLIAEQLYFFETWGHLYFFKALLLLSWQLFLVA